jgi:hypothetical protein
VDNEFVTNVVNVAVVVAFTAQFAIFPLNCRRQAWEKPLKRHFYAAGCSLKAAEMTQMQWIARLMPPLCNLCMSLP